VHKTSDILQKNILYKNKMAPPKIMVSSSSAITSWMKKKRSRSMSIVRRSAGGSGVSSTECAVDPTTGVAANNEGDEVRYVDRSRCDEGPITTAAAAADRSNSSNSGSGCDEGRGDTVLSPFGEMMLSSSRKNSSRPHNNHQQQQQW
jgi:hypothetical protein